MKESYLYKKLENKKILCTNCAHYCTIENGKRGICGVRENKNGKLYSLNYNKLIAVNIDPIEKKPFFHFLPGSFSLSIATVGCNFKCENCQNWEISQMPRLTGKIAGQNIAPDEIVKTAIHKHIPSISYTYTEPTIFSEYALDIMKIAKQNGIKNCWVSNGFWSKELFELISPYLDAANIDLKSFDNNFYIKHCGGRLNPVLDTLKRLKNRRIWIEVTTLVIPTLNDNKKNFYDIANFIKNELGAETPWHITKFSASLSWKLQNLPDTTIETLQMAYEIGKKIGLKYVYTGNIPGVSSEDTFCPKCGSLVIDRNGYEIKRYDKNGKCPNCGENLNLII